MPDPTGIERMSQMERMDSRCPDHIRVMYLMTDSHFGGTEASVMRLALGFRERGFDVRVCSIKRTGYIGSVLKEKGIAFTSLGLPSPVRPIYPFLFLTRLPKWRRLLEQENPDLIHSFLFQSNVLAALGRCLDKRGKKVHPVIASVRCMEINKPRWRILVERRALERADIVLAVSEAVRQQYIVREGIDVRKIKVVYHGVEQRFMEEQASRGEIRVKMGLKRDEQLIGTVARLHKDKGIDLLLEATACALHHNPRLRLVVIGDGPERIRLMTHAKRLGIMKRVSFPGFQADALPWISAMDIFCLTSREEGLPQSLLEAMALGIPVVTTDVGGVREVVSDGVNGMIVPAGDAEAMSRTLLYLLHDAEIAKEMGTRGREGIRRGFLMEETLNRLENIYRTCLAYSEGS